MHATVVSLKIMIMRVVRFQLSLGRWENILECKLGHLTLRQNLQELLLSSWFCLVDAMLREQRNITLCKITSINTSFL